MQSSGENYVPADEKKIGLDRSTVNREGQIQIPNQGPKATNDVFNSQNTIDSNQSGPTSSSSHGLISSLKERKHDATTKIKNKLHIGKSSDNSATDSPVLAETVEGESDSRLLGALPKPEKNTLKDLAHNPVGTVKDKVSGEGNHQVAANIAAKEIPHGQEVDLVNAASAVDRATSEREKLLAIQHLDELLKQRQNMFARWTLDRHVTKLRVLPREDYVKKPLAAFEAKNAQGDVVVDWRGYFQHLLIFYAQQYGGQYIGYGSDPPKPSKRTVMPNVERLLVASSPFQEFAMTVRRVYRWEYPAETAKYLFIYLTLWYLNLLLPGMLSGIVYLIVERRVHGNSMEDLREDIKHREDVTRTALSLTEYIEKKGDETWADDLVEGLGPWAMLQLADMANFFESVRNFYEWRVPSRTWVTLSLLVIGVIATALCPLWLLVKTITFAAGATFFGLFPIATNFPEYRLLASPMKYLLWNIPTHAEWAIKYVQAEGTRYEAEHPHTKTSTSVAQTNVASDDGAIPAVSTVPDTTTTPVTTISQSDYGFYMATHSGTSGRLILDPTSLRFETTVRHKPHFQLLYSQMKKLEKVDRVIAKNIPGLGQSEGKDLKFVDRKGEEWVLENVEKRDECFSQIVGFSGIDWQVVW